MAKLKKANIHEISPITTTQMSTYVLPMVVPENPLGGVALSVAAYPYKKDKHPKRDRMDKIALDLPTLLPAVNPPGRLPRLYVPVNNSRFVIGHLRPLTLPVVQNKFDVIGEGNANVNEWLQGGSFRRSISHFIATNTSMIWHPQELHLYIPRMQGCKEKHATRGCTASNSSRACRAERVR